MFRWAMYIIHDPRENLCKIIRRFSPFSVGKRRRKENGTKRESFVRLDDILYSIQFLNGDFRRNFRRKIVFIYRYFSPKYWRNYRKNGRNDYKS